MIRSYGTGRWTIQVLLYDAKFHTCTNFRGTYISWMPQIQHFHDFIFKDHCPDFYISRQGLNFHGMHIIGEIYIPQKFIRVRYTKYTHKQGTEENAKPYN